MATYLFQRQRVHKGGNHIARLLWVGMSVVVNACGVALYAGDGVADDSLKKLAVGRPLLAICILFEKEFRMYVTHEEDNSTVDLDDEERKYFFHEESSSKEIVKNDSERSGQLDRSSLSSRKGGDGLTLSRQRS